MVSSSESENDCKIVKVRRVPHFADILHRRKRKEKKIEKSSTKLALPEAFSPDVPQDFPKVDMLSLEKALQTYKSGDKKEEEGTFGTHASVTTKEFHFAGVKNYLLPSIDAPNPCPWKNDPGKPPKDLPHQINSVVVSARLGAHIPVELLAERGANLHYNPEKFSGLILRLKEFPSIHVMVFQSGYLVVSGGKCIRDAKKAAQMICKKFLTWGASNLQLFQLRVNNISATVRLDYRLRIHTLLQDGHRGQLGMKPIQLDPHAFNGVCLNVKLANSTCTAVAFATGALLLTGITAESQIQEVVDRLYPILKLYAI